MDEVIKVGDKVEWTSQSGGITRTKRGVIVEVVPPRSNPRMTITGAGMWRDHVSYAVRASVIDGSEAQKKRTKLYWPRVGSLRLVTE
jgi:hypothetical protein